MDQNEIYFVTEEAAEKNTYKNPFKAYVTTGIYFVILAVLLRLPLINFEVNLKYFLPAVYKNFGDFTAKAEVFLTSYLSVLVIIAIAFLCFSAIMYLVFKKFYDFRKPYLSSDIDRVILFYDEIIDMSGINLFINKVKLRGFVNVKSAFCKDFKAELLNASVNEMLLTDTDLECTAHLMKMYSGYIERENLVLFNERLSREYQNTDLETIFYLNNIAKVPFVLEPLATSLAENFELYYNGEITLKTEERKYDLTAKIISFVFLCISLIGAELFGVALAFSYGILKETLESTPLAVAVTLVLSFPVVLIVILFLRLVVKNKKPKLENLDELILPVSEQEVEIAIQKPIEEQKETEKVSVEASTEKKDALKQKKQPKKVSVWFEKLKISAGKSAAAAQKGGAVFVAALWQKLKAVTLKIAVIFIAAFKAIGITLKELYKKSKVQCIEYKKASAQRKIETEKRKKDVLKRKEIQRKQAEEKAKKEKQRKLAEEKAKAEKQRKQAEEKQIAEAQRKAQQQAERKALAQKKKAEREKKKREIEVAVRQSKVVTEKPVKPTKSASVDEIERQKIREQKRIADERAEKAKELYKQRREAERNERIEQKVRERRQKEERKERAKLEQQRALARQIAENKRILMEQKMLRERAAARQKAVTQKRSEDKK